MGSLERRTLQAVGNHGSLIIQHGPYNIAYRKLLLTGLFSGRYHQILNNVIGDSFEIMMNTQGIRGF